MRTTNRRFPGPGTHTSVRRFPRHELAAVGALWMALTAVHAGAQAIPVPTAGDLLATNPRFGEWTPPVNVGPPLNTAYNDNYAVLSRRGLTIYFTSDRPGGFGGDDLWFATRESVDSPWEEPQNMGALINGPYTDSLPFLSSNEHVLYFYSTRPAGSCGPPGPGDIWMTRRRNKHSDWKKPINLGCVLNTSADEIAPAFFEDPETEQAWLFYGSNRPGS